MNARITLSVAAIALVAMASAGAQTIIEPGKTFLLGGEQKLPLLVKGTNVGRVAVEVSADKDGVTRPVTLLAAGAKLSATFAPGELAKFRNPSASTTARLEFELTKPVSTLSMRYAD